MARSGTAAFVIGLGDWAKQYCTFVRSITSVIVIGTFEKVSQCCFCGMSLTVAPMTGSVIAAFMSGQFLLHL